MDRSIPLKRLSEPQVFSGFGIVASLIGILSVVLPGLVYEGTEGEAYSIFNHFISELGEIGVSDLAWVFNGGLILAGLAFIPFMIGLGIYLQNLLAKIAMVVGVFSAITIVLVGVFPMNYSAEHALAALSFFFSGLFMTGLWSLAIIFQSEKRVPKKLSVLGIVSTASFLAFLSAGSGDFAPLDGRPDFLLLPTLEWAVYFSIVGYLMVIALFIWMRTHPNGILDLDEHDHSSSNQHPFK
ncbi:DUF998 domain-containing protein [Candidatus Thorarchaeota archaeon]|nr:MAG: DUF998 domain-containing protein [Candidatus Thorarchaeota archaeon]